MFGTERHRGTITSIVGAATLAAVAIGFLDATARPVEADPATGPGQVAVQSR